MKLDQKKKDPQYDIPLQQTPLQIKNKPKDKQKPTPKRKIQETQNTETMNKFRILGKDEAKSSPLFTKPKTQKNKPTNSVEQRTNNEPPNLISGTAGLSTIKISYKMI